MCESVLMSSIYSSFIPNSGFNIPRISFRSNPATYVPSGMPQKDGYISNPLYDNFGTKAEIECIAKNNPRIREIMTENNLPIKVNEKELEKLKNGHLRAARVTSAKIYSNLPDELKSKVNPKVLQEAAMFHDYGKILIPDEILNKKGKLNDKEWEIMKLHSELGAELLKDKNLDERTIELIKYHHQNANNNGYPLITDNFEYGLDSEILSVADKYEALKEERSYKTPMTKKEALDIIKEDVAEGNISEEVFNSLKKSVE